MFTLVDEGLLDIIGGVELGGLLGRTGSLGLGIVTRENSAVFGLDGPEASLVVHLRPRVLPNPTDEIRVPAHLRCSLLRRH